MEIKKQVLITLLGLVKGLKVLFIYILPATVGAVLLNPEFRQMLLESPELLLNGPLLNFALVAIGTLIKENLGEGNILKKVL